MAPVQLVAPEALMRTLATPARGQKARPEDLGARLAAFTVGCLGTQTAAKAGSKLGLMGSASEEEFGHVLLHLETLTRQRAAKLANVGLPGAADGTTEMKSKDTPSCTQDFASSLLQACGIPTADLPGLFAQLPHDASGRADLLKVFGLISQQPVARAEAVTEGPDLQSLAEGVPADYVENPAELPAVTAAAYALATSQIMGTDAGEAEGAWAKEALALNVVRCALAKGLGSTEVAEQVKPSAALIAAVSSRCSSRRPALAKCALRALGELAGHRGGDPWEDAVCSAIEGCLGALRGTKVVARLAEDTLQGVDLRAVSEQGEVESLKVLVSCLAVEVKIASPQPPVVAAGLRVLAVAAPRLGCAEATGTRETSVAVEALCKDVLANRRFSPSFSQARAVLQGLPVCEEHAQTQAADASPEAPAQPEAAGEN